MNINEKINLTINSHIPHTMQLGDVTKIDWNAFLDRLNLIQFEEGDFE